MAKNTRFYKGKYYQGELSDAEAEAIETLVKDYSSVTSLRHCITDVPTHTIMDIIKDHESYEEEHGTLKGFSKDYGKLGLGTLRDEQTLGVAFMYYAKSCLLGDEVGLGKTVQVAGLASLLAKESQNKGEKFRYCLLTKKAIAGQIREKMIKFTGEFVGLIGSGEREVVACHIEANTPERQYSVVGTHALLANPEFLVYAGKNPFDLIIIDESYILKNTTNEFYKGCKAIFNRHKRKILLNATPLEIELRDIYNQLDLVDRHYLPTVTDFSRRYIKKKKMLFGFKDDGYINQAEFKTAITLRYLARTRQELGAKYAGNEYKTLLIPLSKVQKDLSKKTSMHTMVVDYPSGVDKNVPFNDETTPKLSALKYLVDKKLKDDDSEQLVIYCHFREAQYQIQKQLTEKGYRCVVLNGDRQITQKIRDEIISDYNNGTYNIMITNVLRGLDLSACNTAILYSIDPNPQNMVQFEGRMTREFDIIGKSVYLLVAMGREKNYVDDKLKLRVKASQEFVITGNSMVLSAIGDGGNTVVYQEQMELEEGTT